MRLLLSLLLAVGPTYACIGGGSQCCPPSQPSCGVGPPCSASSSRCFGDANEQTAGCVDLIIDIDGFMILQVLVNAGRRQSAD
ncbi:hypothetical protein ANCDUO_06137 [Ancylostoma duodenale]|uniref:Uncharacterized protein n=1 Tax=Ancylostoma duodenale TaxID=51022 RepID=A0A0C2DLR1_9BILA|nr:hypothetical protein ANCDUO_06137 [Ancylostoma duodenale]